ncbi:MAG: hypothetical protein HN374_00380 [Cryomorphaceae bacterium]|jgi:hypothetical protein|nr:hypothetical protein [Cryomorphaceae bacterium]
MKSRPKKETKEIELALDDDVFIKIALDAHKKNITLNDHINDIFKKTMKYSKYNAENESTPQFLTEE